MPWQVVYVWSEGLTGALMMKMAAVDMLVPFGVKGRPRVL
jgi:hypothetical protein